MIATILFLQAAVNMGGTEVTEASGLVVSVTQPGILWTHNDSGDGPFFYAFDTTGKPRATVSVKGASASDWEDMASGSFPGKRGTWLYGGDIGDNRSRRSEICVYAIPEPKVKPSTKADPLVSPEAIALHATYPDGAHNAETLLCDPKSGRLIIVTKEPSGQSGVYRFPEKPGAMSVLEKIGEFHVPAGGSPLVTGGSFRPDGNGVALVTYSSLLIFEGKEFWKSIPRVTPLPKLKQCEAVAYARDGKSLWLTSEGANAPLVNVGG